MPSSMERYCGIVHGVLAMDAYVFGASVDGLGGRVEAAALTQHAQGRGTRF